MIRPSLDRAFRPTPALVPRSSFAQSVRAAAFGALAAVVCGCLSGCSSFERAWKKAAGAPVSQNGIAGRWTGRWESEENHHGGALRCIVTEQTNGVQLARFHARYKRLFNLTFGYTVPLETVRAGDGMDFHGVASLGWYAGGLYHYEGRANATNFFSTYSCKYDHGTFRMERPVK